jgi:chloramphenicol 3-O-phosphotransferase
MQVVGGTLARMQPIYLVTGSPGAGKTSLCLALLRFHESGLHIHVDELRLWVVRGLAGSIPWTEETERQFRIAEDASCDVATRYQDAGFAVAIDHCRNLARLDGLVAERFAGRPVVKVCLAPSLEENLRRNRIRTNKPFDPGMLEDLIRGLNPQFAAPTPAGWVQIDNTALGAEETAAELRKHIEEAYSGHGE